MPAAAVVFPAHPDDYLTIAAPWTIQESIPSGTVVTSADHSTWIYTPGGAPEYVLGSVIMTRSDADWLAVVSAASPVITIPGPAHSQAWTTDLTHWTIKKGDGAWPAAIRDVGNLLIAWQRIDTDATLTQDETIYWSNIAVMHRRFGWDGKLVDVATAPTLTTQGVIYDLIGRGLGALVEFDPGRVVPGAPWEAVIPHATWWPGASAREVLEFAALKSPRVWWAVWEPGATGRPKLEIGRWDGPVRYVLPPGSTQLQMSGGAAGLANRCLVRYIGTTSGNTKTTWVREVRARVPLLDDAGLVRTMVVDVTSEGLMTTEDARLRGAGALRLSGMAKTAGTAVIGAPIYDRVAGRMVRPHEIRPGSPVIVADAPLAWSRSTSLTGSVTEDGVSVFRHTAVAYDAGRDEATLTLDGGSRSLIHRVKAEAVQRRYDVPDTRV